MTYYFIVEFELFDGWTLASGVVEIGFTCNVSISMFKLIR